MAKAKAKSKGTGTSIRKQTRIPDLPISSIYIYHIMNGEPIRKYEVVYRNKIVYDGEFPDTQVQCTLRTAIESAILNNDPPYYCEGDDLMLMRRKSIVAFVVESDMTLSQNGDIVIQSYKGNYGYHTFTKDQRKYFSFVTNETEVTKKRTFYVSYFLNTMKSTDGQDLAILDYERFYINLPYKKRGKRDGEPGTGGTNMGPPLGPPDRKKKKR